MVAKSVDESLLGVRIVTGSQSIISPHSWFIIQKENGPLRMERAGRHSLKVHVANDGTNWHQVPLYVIHWERFITYRMFLPKTFNLNLAMSKQSRKSKLRDNLQRLTWFLKYFFKSISDKIFKRLGNCSRF